MLKPLNRLVSSMRTRPALLLLAVCLLIPALAGAEWYKDYETAMDLIKKGANAEAIPHLQAAAAQKNEEGSNIKFYGMKFGDYFPHYYLGMTYFSQKNYEAAIREFEISDRSGAIQKKRDLYEKMSNVRTLARAQLSLQKEPVVASNTNPVITTPVTPPPSEIKKEEKIEEKKPVTELNVQRPPVTPVTQENKTVQPSQDKPPVLTTPPVNAGTEAAKLMVKNGARKYFEGDYDSAISYLTNAAEISPDEPSAHFLLGCAYASKYLLSGSENKTLLQSASAAFQRLKKVNPGYQPKNKVYFSPAILDLYAKS